MVERQLKPPVVCPECGFEAKSVQGMSAHRMLKHQVASQRAKQEARLRAQAVSQATDDLYARLDGVRVELVYKIRGARQDALEEVQRVSERARSGRANLVGQINEARQAALEALRQVGELTRALDNIIKAC